MLDVPKFLKHSVLVSLEYKHSIMWCQKKNAEFNIEGRLYIKKEKTKQNFRPE